MTNLRTVIGHKVVKEFASVVGLENGNRKEDSNRKSR